MEESVHTITNKQVGNYYDEFWQTLDKQHQAGINSRHRYILLQLLKSGMKKNSSILEIGCGVGALTGFLARYIPNGRITGVDISPASVEFAKKKYAHLRHVDFLVSDMTSFEHQQQYDIVLFPDVLEHIPTEAHENIFKTVAKLCKPDGIIAINLPQPNCVRWFHKHKPEILQIIDLAIETDHFINLLYPLGFQLFTKHTYVLFLNQPEYEWMVFSRRKEFQDVEFKGRPKVLMQGIRLRCAIWLRQLFC